MGIVNKRNAVLGWLTWTLGKRVAKQKARAAVPAVEGGRPNKPAMSPARRGLGSLRLAQAEAARRRRRRGGCPAGRTPLGAGAEPKSPEAKRRRVRAGARARAALRSTSHGGGAARS